jgi:putative salt-induced outer membrane protein YdiY
MFVLHLSPASAIVNVEQAIIGQLPEGTRTNLDLMADGASGNNDKSSIKANLLTMRKHEEETEFLLLEYAYGKSFGQTDTDRAFAHLRHRTDISASWGVEEFFQIGRDPFARLTRRTLLGGGMRRVLFEENNKSAGYLGIGAFYEREMLTDTLGTSDSLREDLWRASTYLVLKRQLNDQVRLYNSTYYQPAFKDTGDYRILEQASMLVKMAQNLDFKLNLNITFDSKPPQTVQKRDLVYSTGLEFSF